MKIIKRLSLIVCLMIVTFSFAACGKDKDKLVLSSDKITALRGEVITFIAMVEDKDGNINSDDNIVYEISSGEDYAELNENKLTINNDATPGAKIEVVAKLNNLTSNMITITVSVPLEGIVISTATAGIKNVEAGKSILLKKTLSPVTSDVTTDDISWVIADEDKDIAYMNGDRLHIEEGVATGETVKVKAVYGEIESNELTINVGFPLTAISAELNKTEVVKGQTAVVSTVLTPSNATNYNPTYVFTQGEDYCTRNDNVITVKDSAPTDAVIKFKVVSGPIESEELSIEVLATQEEVNETSYCISVDNSIELDKYAASAKNLIVKIYNKNYKLVNDKELTYTIVEGEDLVEAVPDGYSCSFNIKGHGKAVLEIGIKNSTEKALVDIDVVVPPDVISLPEVFSERNNYTYNFARVNLLDNTVDTLPFVATALGNNVCKDVVYSFEHEDGTKGNDVAVYDYEKGEITFNKTGIITVTAKSNSGSRKEASTSYKFNINEGYNVYTYAELQQLAKNANYNGQIINIVVLEKPVGETNYEYGYDLVTDAALKANPTFDEIYKGSSQRINFVFKSAHINGNNHKLDLSQLRAFTPDEIAELKADSVDVKDQSIFAAIAFIPWKAGEVELDELTGRYSVKIYDFEVVGNCGFDYGYAADGSTISGTVVENNIPLGIINVGIVIGETHQRTQYDIDIKNVKASGFNYGFKFAGVVSGTAEELHAYDCYSNGINVSNSIINFKDVKFGKCGSAAMELIPPKSDKAGENFNQNQHITFDGYFDMSANFHNGETNFFNNYKIQEVYTIPQVLQMILVQYNENQISHMKNSTTGEFGFVCFNLSDMTTFSANHSEYEYPIYQNRGGIIKASDLPTSGYDTTHQYIEVEVDLTTTMGVHMGRALLYNHHYEPAV